MRKLLNTLYVTSENSYLALDGENLVVYDEKKELGRLPLHNLDGIVSFGYRGTSPALMGACAERNISLCYLTPQGKFLARVTGKVQGNVLLREQQYKSSKDDEISLTIAKNCIMGKVYNARWVLERAIRDHGMQIDVEGVKKASLHLKESLQYIQNAESKDQLRGYEGEAASIYFGVFNELILQQKNSKIYEGIEVSDIKISHIAVKEKKADTVTLSYETSCNTIAGTIQFDNMAELKKTKQGYKLVWQDSLIFPDLESDDKISVTTSKAERGEILDRDGKMLAGKGVATSVGIIPGKLEDRNVSIEKIAELLEIDVETINNKLTAKWVKEDSFVPIETIPKVEEIDLMKIQPEEKTLEEQDCQNKLLEIPGVMLSDVEVRTYELGEAAAHLIGYVQSVTAEDLENHPGEGYSVESVIGRSGVEKLYEKQLKGKDGCDIKILDSDGEVKEVLASIFKEDGMDIRLTIDSDLQKSLYEQFKEDPGCSVAMNPYTGEVLALVSTPSYDNNEFIRGLSSEKWTSLNEDEKKPLYNRFRQVWCPGSTFKPVVAGIGLKTESIDPKEDFGNEGLAWQKDSSWGSYQVTTLHEYEPVIMKNAIIYSDNIYFAKAALKIGSENFMNTLNEIGFNQNMPFEIAMQESTYSTNTDKIETEIQLADSGYGQGQILVNPLHLASIYTSFLNEGNMIKPYLKYKEEASGETWIENAFSKENVEEIMQGVEGVVNDPEGTGYAAHRDDILLAGKTGTAELKATKEDTSGKEIGWFSVFTADKSVDKPILLISMVENVKGIGGSGYVVKKDATVLEEYFEK